MCSLRREGDLEALVYELLERACLRFRSRAADVINNKWFWMPLRTESTLTCAMVKKRSQPKYRPANGIFLMCKREAVSTPRWEFSVSHFFFFFTGSRLRTRPSWSHRGGCTGLCQQRQLVKLSTAARNNPQPDWKQACPPPTQLTSRDNCSPAQQGQWQHLFFTS